MRLDETSAICRSLINNLKPRNVKVNYIYNYGNSSIISWDEINRKPAL